MAIELKETLQTLESENYFSLRYITEDMKKGTGGKVIELAKCRIARGRPVAKVAGSKPPVSHTGIQRNPNHNFHFTRNLEMQNKTICTVHVALITHINNLTGAVNYNGGPHISDNDIMASLVAHLSESKSAVFFSQSSFDAGIFKAKTGIMAAVKRMRNVVNKNICGINDNF